MRIAELIRAPTPKQTRIKNMQAQVRQAQQRVKAELIHQQQT
jgi:hypothetical protein